MVPEEIRTFDFHIRLPELASGRYTFTPGVADGDLSDFHLCDLAESAFSLRVLPGDNSVLGYLRLPCTVSARTVPDQG